MWRTRFECSELDELLQKMKWTKDTQKCFGICPLLCFCSCFCDKSISQCTALFGLSVYLVLEIIWLHVVFFCRRVCTAWYAVYRPSINSISQVTRPLSPRDWFETFIYVQTPANHIDAFVLFLNDVLGRGVPSQISRSCLQFADTLNKSVTHPVCVQEIFPPKADTH